MAAGSEQSRAAGDAIAEVFQTVETLRDPGGCPWDAAQTHESLRQDILEEVVVEAASGNEALAVAIESHTSLVGGERNHRSFRRLDASEPLRIQRTAP